MKAFVANDPESR